MTRIHVEIPRCTRNDSRFCWRERGKRRAKPAFFPFPFYRMETCHSERSEESHSLTGNGTYQCEFPYFQHHTKCLMTTKESRIKVIYYTLKLHLINEMQNIVISSMFKSD
jgi:hypothetical protein